MPLFRASSTLKRRCISMFCCDLTEEWWRLGNSGVSQATWSCSYASWCRQDIVCTGMKSIRSPRCLNTDLSQIPGVYHSSLHGIYHFFKVFLSARICHCPARGQSLLMLLWYFLYSREFWICCELLDHISTIFSWFSKETGSCSHHHVRLSLIAFHFWPNFTEERVSWIVWSIIYGNK